MEELVEAADGAGEHERQAVAVPVKPSNFVGSILAFLQRA